MLHFVTRLTPRLLALLDAACTHAYGLWLLHPAPTPAALDRLRAHGTRPRAAYAAWVRYGEPFRRCIPGPQAAAAIRALQAALRADTVYRLTDYQTVLLYEACRLFQTEHNELLEPLGPGATRLVGATPVGVLDLATDLVPLLPNPEALAAWIGKRLPAAPRPSLQRLCALAPAEPSDLTLAAAPTAAPTAAAPRLTVITGGRARTPRPALAAPAPHLSLEAAGGRRDPLPTRDPRQGAPSPVTP